MSDIPLIFFAGGGTGGHLYPGVAVAEALRTTFPEAKPVFLCTTREIDRVILQPTGFEFLPQPIVPPTASINGLLGFWKSWRETNDKVKELLRQRKPVAVLGLGGYAASVAVRLAAKKYRIPTALLNPDAIPGKANLYLMPWVKAVCCQFEVTGQYVSPKYRAKLAMTGCPIRSDFRNLPPREQAAANLMVEPNLRTLVVTGASQGAKTVNEAVLELWRTVTLRGWQILHLAGRDQADWVRAGYRELGIAARVIDFTPAMADVWAVADLAISRSGASSCAEMTACGVPSILMPYPFHKDMHQKANGKVLADAGAAILVDDQKNPKKNCEVLKPIVESLLYDLNKRQAMVAAARKLGRPDAAEDVANKITQMARSSR
ncbi:MAG TPA: UDP-N-acetylglucosamine--N-acetylmuramyl-(pentapeptide) pyrophosphoryl-undecaprenol N-acetylglucosamine transferase [Tepidisphaeraceae bacterium]|nr:UDP-N-acetylglucosamine--N-acetylmuramyl-(pentapeptide) pyrophosphoryl-undecaprenol N-acetylglucosamine transferase [Tepidisphaeraceae bacterium]